MKALIGYTGFVGSTLLRQTSFDALYRSTNIQDIGGKSFDLVICAGAPAQKWIANSKPMDDEKNISDLIQHLKTIKATHFVLISTVDVFKSPINVDEKTPVDEADLHPYGLNRRKLEKFVQEHFENHLIVRLPGLVGPGLRKNIIYDFKHSNNLDKVDSRGVFQFYPTVNLWTDILRSIDLRLNLVHLTAEPISVSEIAKEAFGIEFNNHIAPPAKYNFKSIYGKHFEGLVSYQYSKRETILATRAYAQS